LSHDLGGGHHDLIDKGKESLIRKTQRNITYSDEKKRMA